MSVLRSRCGARSRRLRCPSKCRGRSRARGIDDESILRSVILRSAGTSVDCERRPRAAKRRADAAASWETGETETRRLAARATTDRLFALSRSGPTRSRESTSFEAAITAGASRAMLSRARVPRAPFSTATGSLAGSPVASCIPPSVAARPRDATRRGTSDTRCDVGARSRPACPRPGLTDRRVGPPRPVGLASVEASASPGCVHALLAQR